MKKGLFTITLVFAILGTLFITASAKSEFVVENNTLVSYKGNDARVIIPSEVDGEAIIFIDRFAFDTNQSIETVVIPEGVEIICSEAFKNCYNLKKVIVPESLVDICAYAFSGCYDLKPVELKSEWTTINEDAYTDADGNVPVSFFASSDYIMDGGTIVSYNGTDTELVIPETINGVVVTAIGTSAFQGNTAITSVTMPDTIKTIGEQAFYNCSGITTLNLSNNLTSCGKHAFSYCTGLTEVIVPGSLSNMGYGMFQYCSSLKSVKICEGVTNTNEYTFNKCTSLTDVEIPSTLTTIHNWAFGNCGFTTFDIPNTVKSVGAATFYRNLNLASVYMPDSVTYLNSQCFRGCGSLTEFRVSPNVTTIQYRCFDGCKLTEFEVPSKTTFINNEAFYNCLTLNQVVINGETTFGTGIFDYSVTPSRNLVVYAPQSSPAEEYANTNGIASKSIVAENVAIIVGENSLGTYGTINYPITDKVSVIGMNYIPEHLADNKEASVLDVSYDITNIENGNTFMTVMKSIPQEAMDWTYIARPYVKLNDGTTIWGNGKAFGLDFITTTITWEE